MMKAAVEEYGLALEKVLSTHGHMDHAGGPAELAERLGLPIEGPHIEDKFWIDDLAEEGARFGLAGARPFTPERWLERGDTATFCEDMFEARHCPGHTPVHVIFFHAEARFALVGDVLFRGSIGRTDLPRGDRETLLRSTREQLWPLGDDVTFVSGRGPLSTFGDERRTNPYVGD